MRESSRSLVRMLVSLLVLGIGLAGTEASEPWKAPLDAALRAQRDRDWEAADRSFEAALLEARGDGSAEGTEVEILEAWSRSALARGRKDIAAGLLEQAVALRRDGPGARSPAMLESLIRLGNLFQQVGPYESAEAAFRQALALHDEIGEEEPGRLTRLLRGLDTALMRIRPDDPERESLLLRNIAVSETPDHHFLLANYYRANGMYDESLRQTTEAIALLHEKPTVDHAKLASYLLAAAQAHEGLGEFVDAELAYFRALELNEELLGATHPRLSYTLKRIGAMYVDQARYTEAEGYLRRALEIELSAYGQELDVCGCNVRSMLARVEEALGGSVEVASASLEREPPELDEADPRVVELRALEQDIDELRRRGEFETALERAGRALEIREDLFGARSRQAASGRLEMARLLIRRSRHEEAVEMLRSYVDSLEQPGDTSSSRVADALKDLATSARSLGHTEEAREVFDREIRIRENLGQRLHAARRLESVGHLAESLGDHDAARLYFERAESLWIEMAGERAPDVVRVRAAIAAVLVGQERYAEAESLLDGLTEDIEARELDDAALRRYVLRAKRDLFRETGRKTETDETNARLQTLR